MVDLAYLKNPAYDMRWFSSHGTTIRKLGRKKVQGDVPVGRSWGKGKHGVVPVGGSAQTHLKVDGDYHIRNDLGAINYVLNEWVEIVHILLTYRM